MRPKYSFRVKINDCACAMTWESIISSQFQLLVSRINPDVIAKLRKSHKHDCGRKMKFSESLPPPPFPTLIIENENSIVWDLPNRAHFSQLVSGFKSLAGLQAEQLDEFVDVEDVQRVTGRQFDHIRQRNAQIHVAVPRMHIHRLLRQALQDERTTVVAKFDS